MSKPEIDSYTPAPLTPEEALQRITALVGDHSRLMARYEGLSFLRNALTSANAGFLQALIEAKGGNEAGAAALSQKSEEILAMSLATWRAIDTGTELPGKG